MLEMEEKESRHAHLASRLSFTNPDMAQAQAEAEVETDVPVLVVGGGPVGQLTALQLARNGVRCMLVERNATTTKYPKMEYLNMRSMELLARMDLDEKIKEIGVPGHYDLTVLFSTGLSEGGEVFSCWNLKSPDEKMAEMEKLNDGTAMTRPFLRCTQIKVEARLQEEVKREPLIDSRWSTKFESLVEGGDLVTSQLTDSDGNSMTVRSRYVVGCDGAGSRVRRQLEEISWNGQDVPAKVYMVYFRSKDLATLHRQGRFWHIFFTNNCAVVAQDEQELWLIHSIFPPDFDFNTLKPEEVVQRALGGSLAPANIKIDEIVTVSTWRPGIYLADKFTSAQGRVFLAGDAAHQTIPTGGFGLNTGIGDAFDIGWKLASVLSGHAGHRLLNSYDLERRPVPERNTAVALSTWQTHTTWWRWMEDSPDLVTAQSEAGRNLRTKCNEFLQENDQENQDFGIESDYRYNGSPVIVGDGEVAEPRSERSHYVPSTWPGARAPAVFLQDGSTNTHDLFGTGVQFTLFDFSQNGRHTTEFEDEAQKQQLPLHVVRLPDEKHVRSIYERDAVLVRPDGHVAWRCNMAGDRCIDVAGVVSRVTGRSPVAADNAVGSSDMVKQAAEAVQEEIVPAIPSC